MDILVGILIGIACVLLVVLTVDLIMSISVKRAKLEDRIAMLEIKMQHAIKSTQQKKKGK